MTLVTEFHNISVEDIVPTATNMKAEGFRYAQMMCVNTEDGVELQYAYCKDSLLKMFTTPPLLKDAKIPSVSEVFLESFVFENESHDLFGVNIEGIAIDFKGQFYQISQKQPMTIISAEKKAAMEKAAKIKAAKEAKALKDAAAAKAAKTEDSDKAAKTASDAETSSVAKASSETKPATERKGE